MYVNVVDRVRQLLIFFSSYNNVLMGARHFGVWTIVIDRTFWTILDDCQMVQCTSNRIGTTSKSPTNLTSWANKKVSDNDARAQLHVVRPYNKL